MLQTCTTATCPMPMGRLINGEVGDRQDTKQLSSSLLQICTPFTMELCPQSPPLQQAAEVMDGKGSFWRAQL